MCDKNNILLFILENIFVILLAKYLHIIIHLLLSESKQSNLMHNSIKNINFLHYDAKFLEYEYNAIKDGFEPIFSIFNFIEVTMMV